MSGSMNRVQLIGNLGQNPEVRMTSGGKKIVTMSIATSESWNDARSGERQERTEWHRVVIFAEGLADIAEKYLAKGAKVMIEGKLSTRKWTHQDGSDRFSTEIQLQPFQGSLLFLDNKKPTDDRPDGAARTTRQPAMAGAGGSTGAGFAGGDDDEIPFSACWQ